MSRLTYTVKTSRPRGLFTNLATMIARAGNINGWKNIYDNRIRTRAASSPSYWAIAADTSNGFLDMITLAVVGLIENNTAYKTKAIAAAEYAARGRLSSDIYTLRSWSRTGSVVTVTHASHGFVTGTVLRVSASTDTTALPNGNRTITSVATNSYTFNVTGTISASGTCTITYGMYGASTSAAVMRYYMLGLAWVYDLLYSSISSTYRTTIMNSAIQKLKDTTGFSGGHLTLDYNQRIDGHYIGYAASGAVVAMLCSEHADAAAILDDCISFWYGVDASDLRGAITYQRWMGSGGDQKGGSYNLLEMWYTLVLMNGLTNGLVQNSEVPGSLLLDGAPYDVWTDEVWTQHAMHWLMHNLRGTMFSPNPGDPEIVGVDNWVIGDTAYSLPFFHIYNHVCYSSYMAHGSFRKAARWTWELMRSIHDPGSTATYMYTWDFCLCDLADPENPAISDSELHTLYPRSKFFYPPGLLSIRYPNIDPRASCCILIHGQEYDWTGHNSLTVGGIQASVHGDVVLPQTGLYDEFQTTGRNCWGKQSISTSGTVLIEGTNSYDNTTFNRGPVSETCTLVAWTRSGSTITLNHSGQSDWYKKYHGVMPGNTITVSASTSTAALPNQTYTVLSSGATETAYQVTGINAGASNGTCTVVTPNYVRNYYPNALGGQSWMSDTGLSTGVLGPENGYDVTNEGGGLAWKKSDKTEATVAATHDTFFLDCRRAYLRTSADFDSPTKERVKLLHHKIAVIKDAGTTYPVLFRVIRAQSRELSQNKRDHWHSYQTITTTGAGQYTCSGYNGTGYATIHYFNPSAYSYTIVGGGTVVDGFGVDDFRHNGRNWRPCKVPELRELREVGKYRVEVAPLVKAVEDYFVCLIFFGVKTVDTIPAYTMAEEANYFTATFGTTVYKIHKTQWEIVRVGAGGPDTEPPSIVEGVSATPGSGSGQVIVSWTPKVDDTYKYIVEYRTE